MPNSKITWDQVFAGGGSMGGDGAIFVIDKHSNKPLWFFFLKNSDVFYNVVFTAPNEVVCTSTSGLKIKFPIIKPEDFTITF